MNNYFLSKISNINYKMAIHEGDANRRLASQSVEILYKLFPNEVPSKYKEGFNELINYIEKTLKSIKQPGIHPIRIIGIKNVTASKYIKMLIDIENSFIE